MKGSYLTYEIYPLQLFSMNKVDCFRMLQMNGPSFENTKIETALPQIAETVSSLIVGKKSGVLLSIRKLCAS